MHGSGSRVPSNPSQPPQSSSFSAREDLEKKMRLQGDPQDPLADSPDVSRHGTRMEGMNASGDKKNIGKPSQSQPKQSEGQSCQAITRAASSSAQDPEAEISAVAAGAGAPVPAYGQQASVLKPIESGTAILPLATDSCCFYPPPHQSVSSVPYSHARRSFCIIHTCNAVISPVLCVFL